MKYKEAKVSRLNPPLTDEVRDRFLHEFANLCDCAARFNSGAICEDNSAENYYAVAYFMGWKWRQDILIEVAKGLGWPEPEFVDFVHDMVIRLGILPYNPNDPKSHEEFEAAMNGRCSLTKEAGTGKYAFAAQIAYDAWCKAHNRGKKDVDEPAKN